MVGLNNTILSSLLWISRIKLKRMVKMKKSGKEEIIISLTKDEKNAISYFAEQEDMDLLDFIREAIFDKIRLVEPEFQPSSGTPSNAGLYEERMKEGFRGRGGEDSWF
jgi:hypothetical protein